MSDIICICKNVSEATIREAIQNGATSIEAVKEATGAGTGFCKGARCLGKIEALIKEVTKG